MPDIFALIVFALVVAGVVAFALTRKKTGKGKPRGVGGHDSKDR